MNKTQLIAELAQLTHLSKVDCQRVLEATMEITKQRVKKGEEVRLVGFGTFVRSRRSPRRGRNPQTGEELHIEGYATARFRPGKEFKEILANG